MYIVICIMNVARVDPEDSLMTYLNLNLFLYLKGVSHRTRLGTRFQYGILGYTWVDWHEY